MKNLTIRVFHAIFLVITVGCLAQNHFTKILNANISSAFSQAYFLSNFYSPDDFTCLSQCNKYLLCMTLVFENSIQSPSQPNCYLYSYTLNTIISLIPGTSVVYQKKGTIVRI